MSTNLLSNSSGMVYSVFFIVHLQTGLLNFDGFINICFQDKLHFIDLLNIGEPNLTRLNIRGLLD